MTQSTLTTRQHRPLKWSGPDEQREFSLSDHTSLPALAIREAEIMNRLGANRYETDKSKSSRLENRSRRGDSHNNNTSIHTR